MPLDDDELLAELEGVGAKSGLSELRHVRSTAEIQAAEEIAGREKCKDFDNFKPLFQKAKNELASGERQTRPFGKEVSVEIGNFFILSGQLVFVAEVGEKIRAPNGESDARLRVIYDNGTESNLLRRSLQRALYKDEAGSIRRCNMLDIWCRLTESNCPPSPYEGAALPNELKRRFVDSTTLLAC